MIYLSLIDRYGSVLRVEYITRLGIDGCSDCPWTKKHLPNGRSKRGAVILSEMVPLQLVAIVPGQEPGEETPIVIFENPLIHSSYSVRPLRYLKVLGTEVLAQFNILGTKKLIP